MFLLFTYRAAILTTSGGTFFAVFFYLPLYFSGDLRWHHLSLHDER